VAAGRPDEVFWPDDWTATTVDGKRSAQFEHTILVTDSGCELLTARVGASRHAMTWDADAFQR
jgi:methionyl aminopeptidase